MEILGVISLVIVAVAMGAMLVLALRARTKRHRKGLSAIAADLGAQGPREMLLPGPKHKSLAVGLERGAAKLEVYYRGAGKAERLTVLLREPAQPRLVVRREGAADRLGKRLQLNREVQTGDKTFDAAAYVESDESDRVVQRALGTATVRQCLVALLEAGLQSIEFGPDGVSAVARRAARKGPTEAATARAVVDKLAALAPALLPIDPSEIRKPGRARGDLLAAASTLAIGLLMAGLRDLPDDLLDHLAPVTREVGPTVYARAAREAAPEAATRRCTLASRLTDCAGADLRDSGSRGAARRRSRRATATRGRRGAGSRPPDRLP